MNDLQVGITLFSLGVIGHLLLTTTRNWISLILTGNWHSIHSLGNRGEAITEVKFDEAQQKAVDTIVQERLARERAKFGDYEDLKKFKTEFEKQQESKNHEELIKQKKFEEAENGYKNKINEYNGVLSKKDQEIRDLKIGYELTNEVSKNNGYVEESIALLRNNVILDASGVVKVKGRDANGMEVEMPLQDGVKKFLEQRPHLVKSTHKAGAGTGAGDGASSGNSQSGSGQTGDLNSLNAELIEASKGTDIKKISEIKQKIKSLMASKGHR